MTVFLACACGESDERANPDHEPAVCPTCGGHMRATQPPAWMAPPAPPPAPKGTAHG